MESMEESLVPQEYSSYVQESPAFVRPSGSDEDGVWSARVPTGHLPSLTRAPRNSHESQSLDFLERLAQAEARDAQIRNLCQSQPLGEGKHTPAQLTSTQLTLRATYIRSAANNPPPSGPDDATSVATHELILFKSQAEDRLGLVVESAAYATPLADHASSAEPSLVPRQQRVTIKEVSAGSIAAASGLRAGDRLLTINGVSVGSATLATVILKEAAMGFVTVTVERGTDASSSSASLDWPPLVPQLPLKFNNEDGLCLACHQRRCSCRVNGSKVAEVKSDDGGVCVRVRKV